VSSRNARDDARRRRARWGGAAFCAAVLVLAPLLARAAVRTEALPNAPRRGTQVVNQIRSGFVETVIADDLDSPVSLALAPDGRVFVCEQRGTLRLIRDGWLLSKPFVTVPTQAVIEEGLLGVACDPQFARNHWVYVCYTALEPKRHNRVVRFTASGDTALAGSEVRIFDLDDHYEHNHVGGGLRFGRDGKLYISTGENGIGPDAQNLGSTYGKLLRINPDGSIPTDNPFYARTDGRYRAIWARGFRNAFSFDIQPGTGRVFVNDVGEKKFEEVDEAVAGGNYGWPAVEGPGGGAAYRQPIYHYDHATGGCAITGGAFYNPRGATFPREWVGRYFFGEYCRNEIRWLDPVHPANHGVFGITIACGPVDFRVTDDGNLYYLARGNSGPVGGEGTARGIVVRVTHSPIDSPMTPRGAISR
jgi:glucose/arabinose dehydrogenase